MTKFRQILLSVFSFLYLYWFMPIIVADDKVTLVEGFSVLFNIIIFLANFSEYVSDSLKG